MFEQRSVNIASHISQSLNSQTQNSTAKKSSNSDARLIHIFTCPTPDRQRERLETYCSMYIKYCMYYVAAVPMPLANHSPAALRCREHSVRRRHQRHQQPLASTSVFYFFLFSGAGFVVWNERNQQPHSVDILWRQQETITVVTLAAVYHLATMVWGDWVDHFIAIEDH